MLSVKTFQLWLRSKIKIRPFVRHQQAEWVAMTNIMDTKKGVTSSVIEGWGSYRNYSSVGCSVVSLSSCVIYCTSFYIFPFFYNHPTAILSWLSRPLFLSPSTLPHVSVYPRPRKHPPLAPLLPPPSFLRAAFQPFTLSSSRVIEIEYSCKISLNW